MLFVKRKATGEASDTATPAAARPQPSLTLDDNAPEASSTGRAGLFMDSPAPSAPAPAPQRAWLRFGARRRAAPSAPAAPNEAADTVADPTRAGAAAESGPTPRRGRRWPWQRARGEHVDVDDRPRERPIRILMGFLPNVTARDATEFALGVAEKNFDQPGIAFYDAFSYEDGYVYEVHEGGPGRAYAPSVIRYFKSLPPFAPGETHAVVLPTATRSVRIERTRGGLQTVLLPESSSHAPSEDVLATVKMRPAVSKRTGLLVSGAALFVSGFFGLLFSLMARIPAYEAPPAVPVERVDYNRLPTAQWPRLLAVPQDRYVKALRYDNGAWRVDDVPIEEGPPAAGAPAATPAPATPAPAGDRP
jgi:hypothetical protein